MIEKRDGVCGGSACIHSTRIAVWTLVVFRQEGVEDRQILSWYPSLTQQDLDDAWLYYEEHPEEIDQEIYSNRSW